MNVRRATLADARAVALVHVESWRVAYRGLLPDAVLAALSVDRREAQWSEWLQPGSRTVVHVADHDGVVAFAASGPSRDADASAGTGELYALYALAARWGQGDAELLLEPVRALSLARGETSMTLWVLETNARARRFYERHGWSPDGTRATFKVSDGSEHPELRYRRPW